MKEFLARRAEGAVVVDTRNPQEFGTEHPREAVNVPADGRFADQAGTVLFPSDELLVIAPQNREEEIATRLARIGFDKVGGYLRGPEDALTVLADEVTPASRLTAAQLRAEPDGGTPPLVVDVRTCGERSATDRSTRPFTSLSVNSRPV